jgi:putative ABC transport system permease protein
MTHVFRFSNYVLKNLWRHRARTILTVSGAAVAMFVFCFVISIQEGLERITNDQDAQRTLIVFQENRFCPTTSKLPQDYANQIAKLPGVRQVVPVQVWTNNCRASLDMIVFKGVPVESLQRTRRLQLAGAHWTEFQQRRDAAIVGRNVARRRSLKVGDTFSIGEITVHVADVFSSSVPAEENLIYTHLEFLQYTHGQNAAGLVTQHEVHLRDDADADALAISIDQTLASGPVATTTRRKGAFQASTLADLIDLIAFAHYLGYACVGLVLSLVATTTVMSVQDRRQEYAVMQAIGFRPARVGRMILTESTLLCFLGGALGTLVACGVLAAGGLAVGAEAVTIAFRPSWSLGVTAAIVSAVTGLAAGLFPAIQVARMPIVTSLRPVG